MKEIKDKSLPFPLDEEYQNILNQIKIRLIKAQPCAAILLNQELIQFYWDMMNLSEKSLVLSGGITENSGFRHIPLHDEANQLIQQLYKKIDVKVDLVFLSKNNQSFNRIKRSCSSLLKKEANITQFRWHHFVSKLVMVGIDLNTVRELLGHSDIKMTLRYAYLTPEHKMNAVKKIGCSMQGLVSC